MTRVTTEQALYVIDGLVFQGSVPTSTDLAADLIEARAALEPFAEFARKWKAQPLGRTPDDFYAIHVGTDYEARLRVSDCMKALEVIGG